jgi:hypothetical protein
MRSSHALERLDVIFDDDHARGLLKIRRGEGGRTPVAGGEGAAVGETGLAQVFGPLQSVLQQAKRPRWDSSEPYGSSVMQLSLRIFGHSDVALVRGRASTPMPSVPNPEGSLQRSRAEMPP